MAKKISQLTQATEVKSDDVTVIVQDGETKKLPLNMMVTKQDIENKKVAGLAKLDEIEATYENDTYTPTITVKNKSSVKTGEGDEVDYSANVMDGHAKSAILKGQTLVNIVDGIKPYHRLYIKEFYIPTVKTNTNYMIIYDSDTDIETVTTLAIGFLDNTGNIWTGYNKDAPLKGKIILNSGSNPFCFRLNARDTNSTLTVNNIMVIEYQQDMENWNIPYFEGMLSVKMPVLTTRGKNLFDGKIENGAIDLYGNNDGYASNRHRSINYIRVKPNTQYTYSSNIGNQSCNWVFYDKDKNVILRTYTKTITSPSNTYYLRYYSGIPDDTDLTILQVQIEQGSVATSYEPYKSNILSTPSDLELRGIGDVKDELNCLTGEVTERIGEIVLDGSENWTKYEAYATNADGYTSFVATIPSLNNFYDNNIPSFVGANFPTGTWNDYKADGARELVWNHDPNKIGIRVKNEKASNAEEIKSFLSTNNIRIVYKLAKESIKTVDLMPSGTHPSTTPYCWKNGHIQLSSSGLLPSLEYSVVTSRAGQINQNATMIVKNDKRIFDLEILLAGGLVNTTYQALTLQNQVETGLSKVSLNSETEPDYLLYHMIMKLIEEKAYKLDDLTEKVSVFYLYEKLSDEQFETIYSALYPFVEDEIVEEPVVEELPEVVEDEVIM